MSAGHEASIGVRELAEFVHRRGDIHYVYDRSTRAAEGIAAQKRYQKSRQPQLTREVPVTDTWTCDALTLHVRGRIDGYEADRRLVEECKTTRTDIDRLHAHAGALHFAQAMLYAAMLAADERAVDSDSAAETRDSSQVTGGKDKPELDRSDGRGDRDDVTPWCLAVVYLHPEDERARRFERHATTAELRDFFTETCAAYAAWLLEHRRRVERRNVELAAVSFPFPEFRDSQRRIAATVYRTLRDAEHLLLEAPTGTGKTIATVFPALKALGQGVLDRLVYLTSRTTGQRAAEETLEVVVGRTTDAFSAVTVSAKERVCLSPNTPCDPELCAFARGYFDRLPAARAELLRGGAVGRDDIETVARRHTVCPFELSLDAAQWADVVICDYNYVLDPVIRLQRIRGTEHGRVGVLVDEAHQLAERTRDMLTAELNRNSVRRAAKLAPASIARRLSSVDRALRDAGKTIDAEAVQIQRPATLLRALDRLLKSLAEADADLEAVDDACRRTVFDCLRFLFAAEWFDDADFSYVAYDEGAGLRLQMLCLAPGRHIQETFDEFHGVVRFSGTVSPLWLFQHLHGRGGDSATARTSNAFPAERLGVYIVPDIPTYYRQREGSLPQLTAVIKDLLATAPGNYLVALPSFQYLEMLGAALTDASMRLQTRDMTLDEREAFIAWMAETAGPRVGLVVMGGLFAESVDFDRDALQGVIVVTAGLPPPSMERSLIADRFAELGEQVAYQQPAMTRVVQAAGRVVRGRDDSGVVVLVDPRFTRSEVQAFFPPHWQPQVVRHRDVGAVVADFRQRLAEGERTVPQPLEVATV